jgi:hypothetical protein
LGLGQNLRDQSFNSFNEFERPVAGSIIAEAICAEDAGEGHRPAGLGHRLPSFHCNFEILGYWLLTHYLMDAALTFIINYY